MEKQTALITGATSGFGMAIAKRLAPTYNLIITGRREQRLIDLKNELQKSGSTVSYFCFDVRNYAECENAVAAMLAAGNIDVLVNNAGLALGLASIHEGEINDWEVMIDTNIKGLLYMTRLVTPHMVMRKRGHIINIGSIAGKEAYAKGNVYCATKHAVDALSKSMRIDLLPYNIRVTAINPGAAETEFSVVRYHGDEEKAGNVYRGFEPLTAGDIAETVFFALSAPAHVNINDVIIMPSAQANTSHLLRQE